jgi:tetratricopeptide (TPR) repeat protein/uncharacterized RDD family membrane protein YckC
MKKLLFVLMLLMIALPVSAEKVQMDSGLIIEGCVIEVADEYIRIVSDGKIMRLLFSNMDFDSVHYYRNYKVQPCPEESPAAQEASERPKTYKDFANDGMVLAAKGDFEKAIEAFSQAIQMKEDVPQLYFFRAGAYQEMGKLKEAIQDYDKLIRMEPKDPDLYNRRGWVYQLYGQPEKAIEDYSKSLDLDPYDIEILMERYKLNLAAGKNYFAMKDLEQLLWLDPESVEAYLDIAFLNFKMGNYYTAWQNVDHALRNRVEVPRDFIKALDAKMPNPFLKPKKKDITPGDILKYAKDLVVRNSGFFIAAGVSILLAIVVLVWPSFQKQRVLKSRGDEDDPENFLRPVLFVKATVIKRICAALIDLIILSALSWAVVILVRKDVFAVVLGLFYLMKDVFGGVSIGKGLIGIRVVDEHGYRSVFFQGFLRNFTLGLPLVLFYVVFWTAGFRVNNMIRIALIALWACFLFEMLVMVLSKKEGRRIGDRIGGVYVHDLHPSHWRWPYFLLAIILFVGFLPGTLIANVMFSKAFIYKLNPMRYYNIDHDFSCSIPVGWDVASEGEGGLVLENPDKKGSLVFVMNEEARDYALELCVTAFTRSIEESGLEKKTEGELLVSGLPAFRVGFVEKQSGTAIMFVYFKKDRWGPLYIFQASVPAQFMQQFMPEVMGIVNSFRFE